MRGHLSNRDLMESLDADPSGDVRDHLAACATCRAERDRLQATVTGLTDAVHAWADRPEATWDRQVRQILANVDASPSPVPRWRWAVAPALVGLAALAGVWFHGHSPQMLTPTETDEALLAGVQRAVRAEVPSALRPVALLLDAVEDDETTRGRGNRQGG